MVELICGVFPTSGQAEDALDALVSAGHRREDLGIAEKVYWKAAARVAGGTERHMTTWIPGERIVSLPDLGDVLVGGTILAGLTTSARPPSLADALTGLGIAHVHAAWYADQVRRGATLVTLYTDDGSKAAEIMRRRGSIQVPPTARMPGNGREAARPLTEGGGPASADVSTSATENTPGIFPGWEPGGPGYSGLVPQAHEDGANIPSEPEE